MKIGDLVSIEQDRGCGSFKRTDMLGLAVILNVRETARVDIGTATDVYLGDDIVVHMQSTGEVRTFNQDSVRVVNESR